MDSVADFPIMPLAAISLSAVAEDHRRLIRELEHLDPVRTAVSAGALLTRPELQSNCYRLEVLVHLALIHGRGRTSPSAAFMRRAFEELGRGHCGRMEDPAEDLFTANVSTPNGNFTVFEGVREANAFYLQRILAVVDGMPTKPPFESLRRSVDALLAIGHEISKRVGISHSVLGEENPLPSIPDGVCDALWMCRRALRFSREEIEGLNVDPRALDPFVLSESQGQVLAVQTVGHTDLERRPIVLEGDFVYVVLPTAIGTAITRLVVDAMFSTGFVSSFESALAREYSNLIASTPILGEPSYVNIPLQRFDGGHIGAALTEIDAGRILHLIVWIDNVESFRETSLNGSNVNPASVSSAIAEHIRKASNEVQSKAGFRDAITLVIMCGIGRNLFFGIGDLPERWRLEHITAHDLVTVSWIKDFRALSLWRLLESVEAVSRLDVELMNVNGLLNLVAWSKELNGHLVPHGDLPDDFRVAGTHGLIVVRQNSVRALRNEVCVKSAPRRACDPSGQWVRVRKFDDSVFEQDVESPLYASEDDLHAGALRAVYISEDRSWWIKLIHSADADRRSTYEHFKMICCWARRAIPVLEGAYNDIPATPISLDFSFDKIVGATQGALTPASMEEVLAGIEVRVERDSSRITFRVGASFEDGLAQPENVAERALVVSLVGAVADLVGKGSEAKEKEHLSDEICPDAHARWRHRIHAHTFRDFVVNEADLSKPVLIDAMDDAFHRIGLGLRAWGAAGEITGAIESKRCLNAAVQSVLDELCGRLKQFERQAFVTAVIRNHEAAVIDRELWRRTSQANIAVHGNDPRVVRAIVRHVAEVNACCLASRVLIEAAICECPLGAGDSPGDLDISRLMAMVILAHYLGGWSDAVHWGAMDARVRVTPLGDIHMNQSFMESVYEPFGQTGGESEVQRAAEQYDTLYGPPEVVETVSNLLETKFLRAWEAEYFLTVDQFRVFLQELDDIGLNPPRLWYELRRSELIRKLAQSTGINAERAGAALDSITLRPRSAWRSAEPGTTDKDWYPSRFRRRLSLMRRPLIQAEVGEDPRIIVAPGIVRDNLFATMRSFHCGEIPDSQAVSNEMRKWIGHANNVQRSEFNATVADRMRALGWYVDKEVRITKLVGRSLDRDYGDVDVLAWRNDSPRVLAIECKDLHFHKTIGEVAEQLSDFRGEVRADGKRDLLRKHLDRVEVLNSHAGEVARGLRIVGNIQIEGHLVFKNFVPMQFAWHNMQSRIRLSLFDQLDRL